MIKLDTQLKDFRQKFELDQSEIDKLKFQIQHMDSAMKNKDQDLMKIKTDLQLVVNEQSSLETRISSRKNYLNEILKIRSSS